MAKQLSDEHRKHLSESVKLWWQLNKSNKKWMDERSRRLKLAHEGRRRPDVSLRMRGREPPNKGQSIYPLITCPTCGQSFRKRSSSRLVFCSRECWRQFLRAGRWHELHPHTNWYHSTLIKEVKHCERCSFSDERILMVHHKDGNRRNRKRPNLMVLCPNCHMVEHIVNGKLDLHGWHKLTSELAGEEW